MKILIIYFCQTNNTHKLPAQDAEATGLVNQVSQTIKATAAHFQKTTEQIKQILSDSKQTIFSAHQQRTRPHLTNMVPINNKAADYVCAEFTCQLPVTEPTELQEQLKD